MTPVNIGIGTGFVGFCATITQDPRVSFGLMTVLLLTCFVILAHILISCWISNRKAIKKREVRRGRIAKVGSEPQ